MHPSKKQKQLQNESEKRFLGHQRIMNAKKQDESDTTFLSMIHVQYEAMQREYQYESKRRQWADAKVILLLSFSILGFLYLLLHQSPQELMEGILSFVPIITWLVAIFFLGLSLMRNPACHVSSSHIHQMEPDHPEERMLYELEVYVEEIRQQNRKIDQSLKVALILILAACTLILGKSLYLWYLV